MKMYPMFNYAPCREDMGGMEAVWAWEPFCTRWWRL